MSKKAERHPAVLPLSQGSMYEIFRLFMEPLLALKPHTRTVEDWRDTIFHANTRTVVQFEAIGRFKMPGYPVPEEEAAGLRTRTPRRGVKTGERLFARVDVGIPDLVEVEINRLEGQQLFELTGADWLRIKDRVKPVPPFLKKPKDRTWAYYKTKRLLRGED